jgi:hypothetical protein
MTNTLQRTMNENMSIEEQLQKIDEYIILVKSLSYKEMKELQEFYFMYQSEYFQSLETKKWLITEGHGLDKSERRILNKIESLIKKILVDYENERQKQNCNDNNNDNDNDKFNRFLDIFETEMNKIYEKSIKSRKFRWATS